MAGQPEVIRLVDVSARFGLRDRDVVVAAIDSCVPVFYRRQGSGEPLVAVQHVTAEDFRNLIIVVQNAVECLITDWRTFEWKPEWQHLRPSFERPSDSFLSDSMDAADCWLFRHPTPRESAGLRCVCDGNRSTGGGIKITEAADYFIAKADAERLAAKGEWRQVDGWADAATLSVAPQGSAAEPKTTAADSMSLEKYDSRQIRSAYRILGALLLDRFWAAAPPKAKNEDKDRPDEQQIRKLARDLSVTLEGRARWYRKANLSDAAAAIPSNFGLKPDALQEHAVRALRLLREENGLSDLEKH